MTVLSSLDHHRDEEVLKWLDEVNYGLHQSDIFERRQKGTSQWLIDHEHFQTWIKSKGKILFCPGIPGAGKTTMTSAVVDHLLNSFRNNASVGLAYIYCSFRQREAQKTKHILANIAKQLAARKSRLPHTIQELFDRKKSSRPSLEDVISVLHELITQFETTFIVVDGLDECQDSAWNGFLDEIISWSSRSGVNIFATSRYIKEIEGRFRGSLLLPIRATGSDVTKFLEGVIENDPGLGLKDPAAVALIKERMVDDIVEASSGMFLLAKIYIDLIRRLSTKREILEKLNQFRRHKPGASEDDKVQCLQAAYKETMERIRASDTWLLGRNALIWVAFSEWPLSTTEICHALAVRERDTEFDEDGIPSINAVIAACSGLITIEEESEIIRLTHFTVKEYLDLTGEKWFTDPHCHIVGVCCNYLLFDKFVADWPSNRFRTLEARKEAFPLGLYAVRCWGQHAGKAKSLPDSLMRFIFSRSALPAAFFLSIKRPIEDHGDPSEDLPQYGAVNTALRISALHGIQIALQRMIKDGHSAKFDTRQLDLALQEAAYWGHESTVRLLLDAGANLNAGAGPAGTALQAASAHGHLGIMELLLDWDRVDPVRPANIGGALYSASENGQEHAVELLLCKGAEVNGFWGKGRTPLQEATFWGHEGVVQVLLAHGADPNVRLGTDRTPLQAASEAGHQTIVKRLLAAGANIFARPGPYGTALQAACRNSHKAVVQTLLSSSGEAGAEALHLVETDLGVSTDWDGVSMANGDVNCAWFDMVKLVHTHSDRPDRQYLLCYAAKLEESSGLDCWDYQKAMMVPVLIEHGADVNAEYGYKTAIEIALRTGKVKMAQALVDNGATIRESVADLARESGIVKEHTSAKLPTRNSPDSPTPSSESGSTTQLTSESEVSLTERGHRPSKRPRLGSRGSVPERSLALGGND